MWTILWSENGEDRWDRFKFKDELIDFIKWYSEEEYAFYNKKDGEIVFDEDVLIFTPKADQNNTLNLKQLLKKRKKIIGN